MRTEPSEATEFTLKGIMRVSWEERKKRSEPLSGACNSLSGAELPPVFAAVPAAGLASESDWPVFCPASGFCAQPSPPTRNKTHKTVKTGLNIVAPPSI